MICTATPNTSLHKISKLFPLKQSIKLLKNKNKSTVVTATTTVNKDYLTCLPDEILVCIIEQLDSLSTIYQFALTCRKTYIISSIPQSLACWLTKQRGSRFSIYYAILSMPHLCDDHMIKLLINQGAILSRHLIQQLVLNYGKNNNNINTSSSTLLYGKNHHFLQCIQLLPFTGYATLIHQGFQQYGNIMVNDKPQEDKLLSSSNTTASTTLAVNELMNEWHNAIHNYGFIPAPTLSCSSGYARHFLKLVENRPDLYQLISPIFEFDMEARFSLWNCIFLYLLDLSFSNHPLEYHHQQLKPLHSIITPKQIIKFTAIPSSSSSSSSSLAPDNNTNHDLELFIQSFVAFLSKYPKGYCNDKVMDKLLLLLMHYIRPSFDIKVALELMLDRLPSSRQDIVIQLNRFLK
ncbi:hypothetical protein BJ944DRAFT_262278 [Cunninghamella echinulata]|nr:hypothetical protein BJ944DRAFT_262278 [Cunninghamella echinulata]